MKARLITLAAVVALAGCTESTGPAAGTGTVKVAVVTTGGDIDLDGYWLTVDGGVSVPVSAGGSQEFTLGTGSHFVELSGVAANCTVQGDASREVTLVPDEQVFVQFAVACSLTGVTIQTTTTGLDLDPNGYRLMLDGGTNRVIGANGTTVLSRLAPGEHVLVLSDIAPTCELDGSATRTVTVVNGQLAPVAFPLSCKAAWAAVRVVAITTGDDLDGAYLAYLVANPGLTTTVNGGAGTILRVPAGTHQVQLGGVAGNCSVPGGSTREATVTVGGTVRDTAEVTFTVECVNDRGTIQVSVTSSGEPPSGSHRVHLWDDDCYYCGAVASMATGASGSGTVEFTPRSGRYYVSISPAQGCSASGSYTSGVLTLTAGAVLEVEFDVGCGPPQVRVTAPTTGTNQDTQYTVTLWYSDYYWYYNDIAIDLGVLEANGTLTAEAPFAGWYWVSLGDVAANCTVQVQNPGQGFYLAYGQTVDLSFPVACGP